MKLKVKIHLDARQGVLLGLILLALLAAAGAEYVLLPQYDQWVSLREVSQTQAAKYARLTRSLAAGKAVNAAFEKLGQAPRQSDSRAPVISTSCPAKQLVERRPSVVTATRPAAGCQGLWLRRSAVTSTRAMVRHDSCWLRSYTR